MEGLLSTGPIPSSLYKSRVVFSFPESILGLVSYLLDPKGCPKFIVFGPYDDFPFGSQLANNIKMHFKVFLTTFSLLSHNIFTTFSQLSYNFLTTFSQFSHNFLTTFTNFFTTFSQLTHNFLTTLLSLSQIFLIIL